MSSAQTHRYSPLSGVRVLVVDDQEDIVNMLGVALEIEGAVVKTATSVQEAKAYILHWQPALLISDLSMPKENGFDLIRFVRSLPTIKEIPALALSGVHCEQLALQYGYSAFIKKPVDPYKLIEIVTKLALD